MFPINRRMVKAGILPVFVRKKTQRAANYSILIIKNI